MPTFGPFGVSRGSGVAGALTEQTPGYSIYLQKTNLEDNDTPFVEVGSVETAVLATSLDVSSTYLLGIKARNKDRKRSEFFNVVHRLNVDSGGIIRQLPRKPVIVELDYLPSAKIKIGWKLLEPYLPAPDDFEIQIDGVGVAPTVTFVSGKSFYTFTTGTLSIVVHTIKVAARITTGSLETLSDAEFALPRTGTPVTPTGLTPVQVDFT